MNNSEIIGNNEDIQEQRVLGADAGEKFRLALKANKEFITFVKSCVFISKVIFFVKAYIFGGKFIILCKII